MRKLNTVNARNLELSAFAGIVLTSRVVILQDDNIHRIKFSDLAQIGIFTELDINEF